MRRIIYIHGSGTSKKVQASSYESHVWVNLSHRRASLKGTKLWALTISDGLLTTLRNLKIENQLVMMLDKPIFLHRLERRKNISNLDVGMLFCTSNKARRIIKRRLSEMNIFYEDFYVVSDSDIHSFVREVLGAEYKTSEVYKRLSLRQKFKIQIAHHLKLKVKYPSKVRPSTGIATLLIFLFKFQHEDINFIITGITGQISSEDVHPIDKEILNKLKNYSNFKFEKVGETEKPVGIELHNELQNL